mmetsp:Transcript_2532/g.6739  ORF Transcript_2532/g.6739 Transcript_2532/m.6739 type:complete len:122 (+) Transcript_2532:958-1323(+)
MIPVIHVDIECTMITVDEIEMFLLTIHRGGLLSTAQQEGMTITGADTAMFLHMTRRGCMMIIGAEIEMFLPAVRRGGVLSKALEEDMMTTGTEIGTLRPAIRRGGPRSAAQKSNASRTMQL